MNSTPLKVAYLSHDLNLAEAITRAIGEGFQVRTCTATEAPRLQEMVRWADVILLDVRGINSESTPSNYGLLAELQRVPSNPPVVALCDTGDHRAIFEALQHGAQDCVTSPPNMVEMRFILQRTHRYRKAEIELQHLRAQERTPGKLLNLIGSSPAMQEVFELARKIAGCDVNVLITGETGTGKELLAKALHQMSPRSEGPLVAFSCANLPETLIEDELFGHEKGAFTGAMMSRKGRVEAADRGSLFLDEVGDLGFTLQPKLLRVLQERSFEKLGSNKTCSVDVRMISATHRNLAEMVKQGIFREDLYYRLNVVELHLPALRERRDDIPLLAQHFLQSAARQFQKKAKQFSRQALQGLEEHNWPGNVRELENVVQRAVVLSDGPTLELAQLPAALRNIKECPQTPSNANEESHTAGRSYEEEIRRFKRNLILRTLREYGWKKAESARALGVARGYLHRLINQLGIQEETEPANGTPASEPEKPELPVPVGRIM